MSYLNDALNWSSVSTDISNNSTTSIGVGGLVLSNTINTITDVVSFTPQGVYTSSNNITTPYANITQLSIALANIIPNPLTETFGASDTIVVQDTQGVVLPPTESISISTSNRRPGYIGGYTGGYFGLNYDSSGNVDFSIQTSGTGNIVINQVSTGYTGSTPITMIPTTGSIVAKKFIGDLSGNAFSTKNINGGTGGSIPYQSSPNVTAFLDNGIAGQVLTSSGTNLPPTWTTLLGPTGPPGTTGFTSSVTGPTGPTSSVYQTLTQVLVNGISAGGNSITDVNSIQVSSLTDVQTINGYSTNRGSNFQYIANQVKTVTDSSEFIINLNPVITISDIGGYLTNIKVTFSSASPVNNFTLLLYLDTVLLSTSKITGTSLSEASLTIPSFPFSTTSVGQSLILKGQISQGPFSNITVVGGGASYISYSILYKGSSQPPDPIP